MRTVFLSSVSKGIQHYRDAVYKAIEGLEGYHCVRMEDFGAHTLDSDVVCQAKVSECDIFVGILSHEYGSCPPGGTKSYTEREYDAALAAGKPRLAFLAPEEFAVPANLIESDEARAKQAAFRGRVQSDLAVAFFKTHTDLAALVIQAIHNQRNDVLAGRHAPPAAKGYTRLLFPFVTNQSGFNTGIAISNTTADRARETIRRLCHLLLREYKWQSCSTATDVLGR